MHGETRAMSTPALREIQSDAVRLARKILGGVEDPEPQDISPMAMREYAEQLLEIAGRLAYHRTRKPEYQESLRKIVMGKHQEREPR
jgi:hypothetical protein